MYKYERPLGRNGTKHSPILDNDNKLFTCALGLNSSQVQDMTPFYTRPALQGLDRCVLRSGFMKTSFTKQDDIMAINNRMYSDI